MIYEVELEKSSYAKVPLKFEAGTPNVADIIAFGTAIDYIQKIGIKKIKAYESYLAKYFLDNINKINNFEYFGSKNDKRPPPR